MSHKEPLNKLTESIEAAKQLVPIGGLYYHWRTPSQHYKVLDIGLCEWDNTVVVIYQRLDSQYPTIWIRRLRGEDGWLTRVIDKGKEIARFHPVSGP